MSRANIPKLRQLALFLRSAIARLEAEGDSVGEDQDDVDATSGESLLQDHREMLEMVEQMLAEAEDPFNKVFAFTTSTGAKIVAGAAVKYLIELLFD